MGKILESERGIGGRAVASLKQQQTNRREEVNLHKGKNEWTNGTRARARSWVSVLNVYDHFEGSCATERPAEDDALASSSAHARDALSRQFAPSLSLSLCCSSWTCARLELSFGRLLLSVGFEWNFSVHAESSLLDYTLWPSFVKKFRSRFRGNPSFAFRVREAFLLIGYRLWWCVVDYMRVVRWVNEYCLV